MRPVLNYGHLSHLPIIGNHLTWVALGSVEFLRDCRQQRNMNTKEKNALATSGIRITPMFRPCLCWPAKNSAMYTRSVLFFLLLHSSKPKCIAKAERFILLTSVFSLYENLSEIHLQSFQSSGVFRIRDLVQESSNEYCFLRQGCNSNLIYLFQWKIKLQFKMRGCCHCRKTTTPQVVNPCL